MSRRGENIYKRKDGRWEGRIKENGSYKYVYARSYRDVKEKMNLFRQNSNNLKIPKETGLKNASTLFHNWLLEIRQRVKPSTYESYCGCIKNYVIPFFMEIGNEQITEYSVAGFVKIINQNASVAESSKKKYLQYSKLHYVIY